MTTTTTDHPIALSFTDALGAQTQIRGELIEHGSELLLAVRSYPLSITERDARECLRSAVLDGRIQIPRTLEQRLALGKVVLG